MNIRLRALPLAALLFAAGALHAANDRVTIRGKQYYLNGINIAWNHWANDMGSYDSAKFEKVFDSIHDAGGNAIRWWWFTDGSNWPKFDGHKARPLPQSVWDNFDQAFRQAERHGILIMPALWSFDLKNAGRTWVVTDTVAINAFVDSVLTPMVKRYNRHPAMAVWEICNEPEWMMASENNGPIIDSLVVRWHALLAAAIHRADPTALVTTGNGYTKYLSGRGAPINKNYFSDAELKRLAGGDALAFFDVWQTHYYDWMVASWGTYSPWDHGPAYWGLSDKPVLIGEYSAKAQTACCYDASTKKGTVFTPEQFTTVSIDSGYAGTFSWAYLPTRAANDNLVQGVWKDARPGMVAAAAKVGEYIQGKTVSVSARVPSAGARSAFRAGRLLLPAGAQAVEVYGPQGRRIGGTLVRGLQPAWRPAAGLPAGVLVVRIRDAQGWSVEHVAVH